MTIFNTRFFLIRIFYCIYVFKQTVLRLVKLKNVKPMTPRLNTIHVILFVFGLLKISFHSLQACPLSTSWAINCSSDNGFL